MLHIDARQIRSCVTMRGLVDAIARPAAWPQVPDRHRHDVPGRGALLLMPAWDEATLGVKIVTYFPDNRATGLPSVMGQYLLLSGRTGEAIALIDGTELTLWRTAAVAAAAALLLAPARPANILVLGTGALAPSLVEAYRVLYPAARLALWGRNREAAAALAERLDAEVAPDLEAAAGRADIICCATAARAPLLLGAWLKDEVHVCLLGGFSPDMREADDEVVRAAAIYADAPAAMAEAGDLVAPIASGVVDPARIILLPEVPGRPRRPAPKTVFKSIGNAGYDLLAAHHIFRAVRG